MKTTTTEKRKIATVKGVSFFKFPVCCRKLYNWPALKGWALSHSKSICTTAFHTDAAVTLKGGLSCSEPEFLARPRVSH